MLVVLMMMMMMVMMVMMQLFHVLRAKDHLKEVIALRSHLTIGRELGFFLEPSF